MADSVHVRRGIEIAIRNVWPNDVELYTDNAALDPAPSDEFGRVAIRHLDASQRTLGAPGQRKFRREAIAVTQVFSKQGQRFTELDRLATLVRNALEGKQIVGYELDQDNCPIPLTGPNAHAYFGAVNINEVGYDDKEAYFQVNVEAPFYYITTA